jgi:GTP cyclohydrolase I
MSIAHRVPVLPFPDPAAESVSRLLHSLGEDVSREGLVRTPERVAKSLSFLTGGMRQSWRDVLNGAIFRESCRGCVLVKDIEFYSLCEHHMLPFHGRAHIAYLPEGKVLGLSKLPRLLDVYARRLQVQERLTVEVATAIREAIKPRGVAVMLDASHFCMMMRGVSKQGSRTTTTEFLGEFRKNESLRREFLAAVFGSAAAEPGPAAPAAGSFAPQQAEPHRGAAPPRRPSTRRADYRQGRLWQRHQALTARR